MKSQNSGQLSVWNHDPCIKLGWCRLPVVWLVLRCCDESSWARNQLRGPSLCDKSILDLPSFDSVRQLTVVGAVCLLSFALHSVPLQDHDYRPPPTTYLLTMHCNVTVHTGTFHHLAFLGLIHVGCIPNLELFLHQLGTTSPKHA